MRPPASPVLRAHGRGAGYEVRMNPLERLVTALVNAVLGIVRALIDGILGAPGTAVKRATAPIDVTDARPDEVVDLRHRVLREGRPRETAVFEGDDEPRTRHWVARQADRIIGVVTVLERPFPAPDTLEPTHGPPPLRQLRGMATDPAWRGRGVGRAMLEAVEQQLDEPLWCNARTSAAAFYLRHGWRQVGPAFEIPEVGLHVRMVRDPSQRVVARGGLVTDRTDGGTGG